MILRFGRVLKKKHSAQDKPSTVTYLDRWCNYHSGGSPDRQTVLAHPLLVVQ